MRALRLLCLALLGMGLASCGEKSPSEPPVMYALTVKLGNGVSGNITSGAHKYASGDRVDYNFLPTNGHKDVVVELSGSIVKTSGSFVMDTDKELVAVADTIMVFPAAAEPLKTDAVRFMVSPDPASAVSAYEAYLRSLDRLYLFNSDQAYTLAQAAYQRAYEDTPDAVREKAEAALAGKLFGPDGIVSQPSAADPSGSTVRTSVIYVNGILNSADDAALARKELEKVVAEAGLASKVEVYNFYNASGLYDLAAQQKCLLREFILGGPPVMPLCGYITDVKQLLAQSLEILLKVKAANTQTEAQALAKLIKQERDRGRSVLVVGHSQGTMMATQAVMANRTTNGCVAAISLGGVLGKSSWVPISYPDLDGYVVTGEAVGDIVLSLRLNDFPQAVTEMARAADKRLKSFTEDSTSLVVAREKLRESYKLHSMTGSYLASSDSRKALANMLKFLIRNFEQKEHCPPDPGTRVYAVSGIANNDGSVSAPSHLWSVDPRPSGQDSLIGPIKTAAGKDLVVTDLAESPTGELLAITNDELYRVSKTTAIASFVAKFTNIPTDKPCMNALTFDGQGRVYAACRGNGKVIGFTRDLLEVFWRGDFGSIFISAGDLAVSPGGVLYGIGENGSGVNYLVHFNTPNHFAEPIGNETNTIGFSKVWGITFVGNTLYGFAGYPIPGFGSLITIDLATGKGTRVRELPFVPVGSSRISRRFDGVTPP